MEYACPVWHTSLPMYLSDHIETIQKRCLRTIFPGYSYDEARSISNLPTLFERRTKLCQSYFRKMQNADHKLHKLLPKQRSIPYGLRTYNTQWRIVGSRGPGARNSVGPSATCLNWRSGGAGSPPPAGSVAEPRRQSILATIY